MTRDEMIEQAVELASAAVHEKWMATKRGQGVSSRCSESGEELMVPYDQLSEAAKDLDRGSVAATVDALLNTGWRPPLPDTLSPWDAYREAYNDFRRDVPSWKAHFTAHHMHALEAALRVYDPCAEHGDLLQRYVAASLEFDYTAEGESGGDHEDDVTEHEAAITNIAEMHRLLNVRAERLAEAHEKLRALSSPPPDSETEWGPVDRGDLVTEDNRIPDEFDDYLAQAMENSEFRVAFDRAQRRPRWRQWLLDVWARRPFRASEERAIPEPTEGGPK